MKQDVWTNTKTLNEYGVTGPLGSPRAWLRRALDVPNLIDTTFETGSLTQAEISIAGIWYKTPEGYGLPVTGMHRELFRWYHIPTPERMMRPRDTDLVPAIGLCAAVPTREVMKWLKVYQEHGAAFVWWKKPENSAKRAVGSAPRKTRRQLDHHAVYELLDQGLTQAEVARRLDCAPPAVDYVARKWRAGEALPERKPHLDRMAIFDARQRGIPVKEIALQHDTSTAYIYRIIGDYC
jgi:hypothetical protein